ncbi:MAG: hypothetical protein RSA53_05400 [Odoribacter sp.]
MKKVTITIRREQTYAIEIDDSKLDKQFIDAWSKYMTDITDEPNELCMDDIERVGENNYPYLNLAKEIAYNVMVNECDYVEGLKFQHVVDNDIITIAPDRENYSVWYEQVGYPDTEYEFDLDNTEL